MSGGGLFVGLQVGQVNQVGFYAVKFGYNALGETITEIDAGNRCVNLYPDRRHAHADDLPFLEEKFRR